MHTIDVIVGLQHGDEGKGKIAYLFSQSQPYDAYVRFNGGPNAGHTVYHKAKKVILHHIPCGILMGRSCLISSNCVIDLPSLKEEIEMLVDHGIAVYDLLHIAYNAHIILPSYIKEDKKKDKIGSTNKGIGPAYGHKINRTGVQVKNRLESSSKILECHVVDPYVFLKSKDKLLFEGAQGFELDIDWGDYPYVTSSSCLTGSIFINGIPPQNIRKVIGVSKIYETYVGKKSFQPENDKDLEKLQIIGEEFGATTGRSRQCNWLNLDRLKRSCYINSVSVLIFNKCDILEELNIFKLIDNNTIHHFNSLDAMKAYIDAALSDMPFTETIYSSSPDAL